MAVSIKSEYSAAQAVEGGPLSQCRHGDYVEVLSIGSTVSCAARLRELGLLEGQLLRIARRSDPLLLDVKGSLIAIDLDTAAGIEVRDAQCS